jgi:hypothetical protein
MSKINPFVEKWREKLNKNNMKINRKLDWNTMKSLDQDITWVWWIVAFVIIFSFGVAYSAHAQENEAAPTPQVTHEQLVPVVNEPAPVNPGLVPTATQPTTPAPQPEPEEPRTSGGRSGGYVACTPRWAHLERCETQAKIGLLKQIVSLYQQIIDLLS